jgi:hypothetical protein
MTELQKHCYKAKTAFMVLMDLKEPLFILNLSFILYSAFCAYNNDIISKIYWFVTIVY